MLTTSFPVLLNQRQTVSKIAVIAIDFKDKDTLKSAHLRITRER